MLLFPAFSSLRTLRQTDDSVLSWQRTPVHEAAVLLGSAINVTESHDPTTTTQLPISARRVGTTDYVDC